MVLLLLSVVVKVCLNILVIVVDDFGWFDFGVFGGEIDILNFDKLVLLGVCFIGWYIVLICLLIWLMLMSGVDSYEVGFGMMVEMLSLVE